MKKLITICLLVAFVATPAAVAAVREGHFQVEVYTATSISWDPLLNDGYERTWYEYPQPALSEPPPPWWNEWFWNDEYLKPGGKWIQITFDYDLINPEAPGDVVVTINWTNGLWQEEAAPPTWQNSLDPEAYIERLSEHNVNPWHFFLEPGSPSDSWDSDVYWLPIDYNPEWVSVDVQGGGNVGISNGVLLHECVPEPTTVCLLGLGALSLLRRRKH